MLTGISKFCASALLKKGAIEERDVNDVRFGIEVFITHIITFSSILIIGIMIDYFMETALFCVLSFKIILKWLSCKNFFPMFYIIERNIFIYTYSSKLCI